MHDPVAAAHADLLTARSLINPLEEPVVVKHDVLLGAPLDGQPASQPASQPAQQLTVITNII